MPDASISDFVVHSDTAAGLDTHRESYSLTRPHMITEVYVIGENPADADADTIAVDVSYSEDGFSSDDNEVAAKAAGEFNDTDNDLGTLRTRIPIPLSSLTAGTRGRRVPAGAVVEVTITWTGAPADGRATVGVERTIQ